MPNKDGTLTAMEQANIANLAVNINRASAKSRQALAQAAKIAAETNPQFKAAIQPWLDGDLKDALAEEQPKSEPKPEDKPLTRAEVQALLAEEEGTRRANSAKADHAAARQKLLDDGRFTADSIKALDSYIEDNGYQSLPIEHAVVLFQNDHPTPAQRPVTGAGDNMWQLPKAKDLLANPRKTGLERAYQVVDEMQRRRA